MSIRAIAKDLYSAQQKYDALKRQFDDCPPSERDKVKIEMEVARKELEILRGMLEGEKESGDFRKRFDGFGISRTK